MPKGFAPVSFTAVSADQYWLLGTAPCSNPVCTSIVGTTDGGAHFSGVPAPQVPLSGAGLTGQQDGNGIDTLRFADALDGYAFGTGGDQFWDTHDGGSTWAAPGFMSGRSLLAFGTGAGFAFALVGSCQSGTCSNVVVERSPVHTDNWSSLAVPLPSGISGLASMAVHGTDLWVSATTGAAQANQVLVMSTSSGAGFTTGQSPCFSGLGGTLSATSAQVVWAVCPTGMLAEVFRSADGGRTWAGLGSNTGEVSNGAVLAAASDSTAVLAPGGATQLLRTTDGGSTWSPVPGTGSGSLGWSWAGFTTPTTGAALRSSSGPASGEQLWRTTDGGASWSGPVSFG